jgi:hypothetical protein
MLGAFNLNTKKLKLSQIYLDEMAEKVEFKQVPISCQPDDLKSVRNIGISVTILLTTLLVILLFQIEYYFNIFYMIAIYLIGLFLFFLVLANNNLSKHLILTKNGFYQVGHLFPFSKCNSLYKGNKIIKWNDVELYIDLISLVSIWVRKEKKRKIFYFSFKKKEEINSKKVLFREFEKRGIKREKNSEEFQ